MSKIKNICFACVYVDDYQQALRFYKKHFGYEELYKMGEKASWGKAGGAGLYIDGGCREVRITDKCVRASVVFGVDSAWQFFEQLKTDEVETLQPEPEDMGEGDFWFQFRDPSGNILEVMGGR